MTKSKVFDISNAIALAIGLFVDLVAIHQLLNQTSKTIEEGKNLGLTAILFISSVYLLIFAGIGTRRFFHSRAEPSSSIFLTRQAFNEIEKVTSLTQYLLAIPCGILFLTIFPWNRILLILVLYIIVEISRYSSRIFYLSLTPNYRVIVPRKILDLSPSSIMREKMKRMQDAELRSWEIQEDNTFNK